MPEGECLWISRLDRAEMLDIVVCAVLKFVPNFVYKRSCITILSNRSWESIMKPVLTCLVALLLASCVSNIDSARLVLSEPNDSAKLSTLTQNHDLHITESRMLVYNGEEQFEVPDGQLVVFEIDRAEQPVFTLLRKGGRHINWNFDF